MYINLPKLSTILQDPKYKFKIKPSATNLICNIINSLNIKSIAIPYFLCEEILISINSCNIEINYYKIDKEYSPRLENKHLNCDCLFICDFFGYPIKEKKNIKSFFSTKNKIIIFDRSHSLLAGNNFDDYLLNSKNKIFLIYSLRKFIPTINGALLVSNININKINYKNTLISSHNILSSFLKIFLKSFLASNNSGRKLLANRQIKKIKSRKNKLNGYEITKPKLKKKIELGYNNNFLDFRNKKYITKNYLKKLEKKRFNDLLEIKDALRSLLRSKDFKIKAIIEDYGVPYGLILKIGKYLTKEELEKSITLPLLKINNKAEIILWPYNNLENYKVENMQLKSTILIIPRISYV